MATKQISEFDVGTDFALTSILHSKDRTDDADIQVTVQDLVDLIPDTSEEIIPVSGGAYDGANDELVFADDSLGGVIRKLPAASILTAAGAATASGTPSAGNYKIGTLELRWGSEVTSTDSAEVFTFSAAFTTQCSAVFCQRAAANQKYALSTSAVSSTTFTVDRDSAIDGATAFYYLAIGY